MKNRTCRIHTAVIALLLLTPSTNAAAQTPVARQPAPAPIPEAAPPDQDPELHQLLDTSLGSLADWSRRDRRTGGYVMLGLGAAAVTGGVATLAFGDTDTDNVRLVGYSLIGGGVLLGGLSLLPFTIRGEAERVYDEFSEMPSGTSSEVRTRFAYGDRRFQELAHNRRTERYISGVVLLAIGITELFLLDDTRRWISFGTPLVGGVTTLLVRSEEERRYETYQRAKEDLIGSSDDAPTVGVGLTVLPRHGLAAVVQVRF